MTMDFVTRQSMSVEDVVVCQITQQYPCSKYHEHAWHYNAFVSPGNLAVQ